MNDRIEDILRQAAPHKPDARARGSVLEAVEAELAAPGRRRWDALVAAAAVVLLGVGIGFSWWTGQHHQRRLAELLGPETVPAAVAQLQEMIASVTDEETGRRYADQLLRAHRAQVATPESVCSATSFHFAAGLFPEDFFDETIKTRPEVDRHRWPGADRGSYYRPLGSGLAIGQTA